MNQKILYMQIQDERDLVLEEQVEKLKEREKAKYLRSQKTKDGQNRKKLNIIKRTEKLKSTAAMPNGIIQENIFRTTKINTFIKS